MILQLSSLLDKSSDEHIGIWDHGIGGENLLNPVGDWGGNRVCLIDEKAS